MKKAEKVITIFSYLFLITYYLFFVSGCREVFHSLDSDGAGGKLTISIVSGDNGRTLYPSANFTKYVLSFSGSGQKDDITLANGQTQHVVSDLAEGSWTITVKGYVRIDGTEYEAASGSQTVTISDGINQNIAIKISAGQDGDDGYFTYNITVPQGLTVAGIVLLDMDNTIIERINLYESNSGKIPLSPGYYIMNMYIETGYKDIGKSEVIHIYTNMETKAEYTYTMEDFSPTVILSGTVNLTINNNPTNYIANVRAYSYTNGIDISCYGRINHEDGTWSINFPFININEGLTVSFSVEYNNGFFWENSSNSIMELSIPGNENTPGIDLGDVNFDTIPFQPTPLIENEWTDGATENGVHWFSFTAGADMHYIHFDINNGYCYYAGVYDENGTIITGWSDIWNDVSYSLNTVYGKTYYIKCNWYYDWGNSNAHRIAFNTSPTPPDSSNNGNGDWTVPGNATPLTENEWADGETGQGKDQWYSFTVNVNSMYVHILPGTATSLFIYIYDSNGEIVENEVYLDSLSGFTKGPWSLNTSKTYYIKLPSNYPGTFQIAINNSVTPPPITLPTENFITLFENIWADGTTEGGEWYKFTANAATQYIHLDFTTATGAGVNMYDSAGNRVGDQNYLGEKHGLPYFFRELTNGSVYYLHVFRGMYHGDFRITFNASEAPPAITLPTDGIIELTANTWSTNSTSYNGKHWFSFTADSDEQYIHIRDVDTEITLRLYDASGNALGTTVRCGPQPNIYFFTQTITIGQLYYIKAEGVGYNSNNYKISFNDSEEPPEME